MKVVNFLNKEGFLYLVMLFAGAYFLIGTIMNLEIIYTPRRVKSIINLVGKKMTRVILFVFGIISLLIGLNVFI